MKKKRMGRFKRFLVRLGLAVVLLHAGTQVNYWINDIYNWASPSKQRKEFEKKLGFPIYGWRSDIEDKKGVLLTLCEIIRREKAEKDFDLVSIRIRSDNYLKKSVLQQLEQIILKESNAFYVPFLNQIVLNEHFSAHTLHHEIKHAKTFDMLDENPELLDDWGALALDKDGNSLYLTTGEQLCKRIRGLDYFVDNKKQIFEVNEKLGFVSNYARTNVFEDIAELCEDVENNPRQFIKWISDGEYHNPIITAKVKLAQKYGLIPAEFSEYVDLQRTLLEALGSRSTIADADKADEFLEKSEVFLKMHPETVYECELRADRGWLLERRYSFLEEDYESSMQKAIKEYEKSLKAKIKERAAYVSALDRLFKYYLFSGDEERAEVYKVAKKEYLKKLYSDDLSLSEKGVNDYLISKGELD